MLLAKYRTYLDFDSFPTSVLFLFQDPIENLTSHLVVPSP